MKINVINKENWFENTEIYWTPVQPTTAQVKAYDLYFISSTNSLYFYDKKTNLLLRYSDHWGACGSNHWYLEFKTDHTSPPEPALYCERSTKIQCGICNFNDIKPTEKFSSKIKLDSQQALAHKLTVKTTQHLKWVNKWNLTKV